MGKDQFYRIINNPDKKNQIDLVFENFEKVTIVEIDLYNMSGINVYSTWMDISDFHCTIILPETLPFGKYVIRVKVDSQFQQDEFLAI